MDTGTLPKDTVKEATDNPRMLGDLLSSNIVIPRDLRPAIDPNAVPEGTERVAGKPDPVPMQTVPPPKNFSEENGGIPTPELKTDVGAGTLYKAKNGESFFIRRTLPGELTAVNSKGEKIGEMTVGANANTGEEANYPAYVHVEDAYRGQGVGSALYAELSKAHGGDIRPSGELAPTLGKFG